MTFENVDCNNLTFFFFLYINIYVKLSLISLFFSFQTKNGFEEWILSKFFDLDQRLYKRRFEIPQCRRIKCGFQKWAEILQVSVLLTIANNNLIMQENSLFNREDTYQGDSLSTYQISYDDFKEEESSKM